MKLKPTKLWDLGANVLVAAVAAWIATRIAYENFPPISVFAGFLGVGPGFLLMPTLALVGYSARLAAATNSPMTMRSSIGLTVENRTPSSST